jgi:hypothetical protein
VRTEGDAFLANLRRLFPEAGTSPPARGKVYHRNAAVRGSLDAFGYDYLTDHLAKDPSRKLALPEFEGPRGGGEDYAYEALNLVDGKRTTSEIRDALSAIYGPVPQDAVDAYLAVLAEAGLVR